MIVSPIDDSEADEASKHYWMTLGRFIEVFSLAENTMQWALRRFSKVRASVAPVLFSGTRMDAATAQIKRISEVDEWDGDRKYKLDTVLGQLGEITRTRNDLLHFGAFSDGAGYLVSNALHAHTADRLRETKIDPIILDRMSVDLMAIICHVHAIFGKPILLEADLPQVGAWLYRPERRQGPREKHQVRSPKPKRRRKPSLG